MARSVMRHADLRVLCLSLLKLRTKHGVQDGQVPLACAHDERAASGPEALRIVHSSRNCMSSRT
jgi:hypothetical protein